MDAFYRMTVVNVTTPANKWKNMSRKAAIQWVNELLDAHYEKVEELCTGAAYCQIFDLIFPGAVPLGKVKFTAHLENEFIQNFKLLQAAFAKKQVDRDINVPQIVKGLYKYNFELVEWFHKFYEANYRGKGDYDALVLRKYKFLGSPGAVRPQKPRKSRCESRCITPRSCSRDSPRELSPKCCDIVRSPPLEAMHLEDLMSEIKRLKLLNKQLNRYLKSTERELNFCDYKLHKVEKYCLNTGRRYRRAMLPILEIVYMLPEEAASVNHGAFGGEGYNREVN